MSTKYQKSEVIAKIVAEVRAKSPGGGFVKKDFYSNRWFEVGDEKARDKVGKSQVKERRASQRTCINVSNSLVSRSILFDRPCYQKSRSWAWKEASRE